MSTKYVKFSPQNGVAAETYVTFLEAGMTALGHAASCVPWPLRYDETLGPDFPQGGLWRDTNLNYVVGWFGPPFALNGIVVEPIEGDEEARELGVLVDTPDWYQFD